MNRAELIGRLTADPTVRHTATITVASGCVACARAHKKEGQPDSDFINFTAFGKTAEYIEKSWTKGMRVGVEGRIQTSNWTDKNGEKHYKTEVLAENVETLESKVVRGDNSNSVESPQADGNGSGFMNIPNGLDEELPFM